MIRVEIRFIIFLDEEREKENKDRGGDQKLFEYSNKLST